MISPHGHPFPRSSASLFRSWPGAHEQKPTRPECPLHPHTLSHVFAHRRRSVNIGFRCFCHSGLTPTPWGRCAATPGHRGRAVAAVEQPKRVGAAARITVRPDARLVESSAPRSAGPPGLTILHAPDGPTLGASPHSQGVAGHRLFHGGSVPPSTRTHRAPSAGTHAAITGFFVTTLLSPTATSMTDHTAGGARHSRRRFESGLSIRSPPARSSRSRPEA